jgi:hypothetical protein
LSSFIALDPHAENGGGLADALAWQQVLQDAPA